MLLRALATIATIATIAAAVAALAGCDALGIESPEKVAAARQADGKAIGGACRHAGRAIEDCYALNKKADKASVFTGWRDMNDYMRENKIEAVAPVLVSPMPASKTAAAPADDVPEPAAEKPSVKADAGKRSKAQSS